MPGVAFLGRYVAVRPAKLQLVDRVVRNNEELTKTKELPPSGSEPYLHVAASRSLLRPAPRHPSLRLKPLTAPPASPPHSVRCIAVPLRFLIAEKFSHILGLSLCSPEEISFRNCVREMHIHHMGNKYRKS
ncbi:hypothetical protein MUK42_10360 [Musa troglodytarum]|uniref:Uncharacterized protein n=1 Tax=Musa troglodytarum TaxID=320322 RepID=A0A9E7FMD2_9LILI|nr:hypothetical protein MUK42_10360 [Musa troglodytarum]